MKPLNHVERRVRMVLSVFAEHGPMTSATLAQHLGLPSAETPLEGRKLRHILGDIGLSDWITRTGHKVRQRNRVLPIFQLTPDGREHLARLSSRLPATQVSQHKLNGLANVLKQARPVMRTPAEFTAPVSRTVPAPEKPTPLPPYPIVGHAPQREQRLPLADKLSCLESSAAQRNSQDLKLMVAVLIELHQKLERFERYLAAVHASTQEVLPKEAS